MSEVSSAPCALCCVTDGVSSSLLHLWAVETEVCSPSSYVSCVLLDSSVPHVLLQVMVKEPDDKVTHTIKLGSQPIAFEEIKVWLQ